jgi:pimeloyl-ACP methyl ester carboxylesterase
LLESVLEDVVGPDRERERGERGLIRQIAGRVHDAMVARMSFLFRSFNARIPSIAFTSSRGWLSIDEGDTDVRSHLFPVAAAALMLGTFGCGAARADEPPTPADVSLDFYAEPGELVDIGGGRKLNLRCSGSGAPTVVLDIGTGMTSMSWRKVQPLIAAKHRVCSYDRAGFAFSDPGPPPRSAQAEANDLHALVHAAKLQTPLILVGHSRASYIARLYASAHPTDIAGLVLVDPGSETLATDAPAYAETEAKIIAENDAFSRKCADAAREGDLAKATPIAKECVPGAIPGLSQKLGDSIRDRYRRPSWWETLLSERDSDAANVAAVKATLLPKDIPLIVLSADGGRDWVPAAERAAADEAYAKGHKRIAAQSSRGVVVTVDKGSHDIQEKRPDAIADAVEQIDAQIRRARAAP